MADSTSKGGLGFRPLIDFNKAMLGKECWILLKLPNSLVGRLMQARYFPKSNFSLDGLQSNPSFA